MKWEQYPNLHHNSYKCLETLTLWFSKGAILCIHQICKYSAPEAVFYSGQGPNPVSTQSRCLTCSSLHISHRQIGFSSPQSYQYLLLPDWLLVPQRYSVPTPTTVSSSIAYHSLAETYSTAVSICKCYSSQTKITQSKLQICTQKH